MTQLSLLDVRPAVAPVSVTRLLWETAGRPTNTTDLHGTVDATRVPGALCWWCGQAAPDGWARPRSILPDTFPFPLQAAVPESEWLCLPCGWTLCDRVALPGEIARERIRLRARAGGRLIVSVRGGPAERRLLLELPDGRVGLWPVVGNAASEEPWHAAVAAGQVPEGMLEAVTYDDLAPEATEKFRAYHHLACRGRWWPCTDSHRMGIRAWLLSPPEPPWVCVIGDGKKHAAVAAQLQDCVTTSTDLCTIWHRGDVVRYAPAELAALVEAVEALVRAGASDDEVAQGAYAPRDLDLARAIRAHDATVAPYRGGPTLPLAIYLRRNRKELAACS